jgi:hypothetical protein
MKPFNDFNFIIFTSQHACSTNQHAWSISRGTGTDSLYMIAVFRSDEIVDLRALWLYRQQIFCTHVHLICLISRGTNLAIMFIPYKFLSVVLSQ